MSIEIVEESLGITLPSNRLRMVLMQPFVDLVPSEPFRWKSELVDAQIAQIKKTLEIAQSDLHGCDRTHFTIFPEYSIPGLRGISEVESVLGLGTWKPGTVVVGGVDGLTHSEYEELCPVESPMSQPRTNVTRSESDTWVNCCAIWAKVGPNSVKRFVQSKLVPNHPELQATCTYMSRGSRMNLFWCDFDNGVRCGFLVMTCYDWIGAINGGNGVWAVLEAVNRAWRESRRGNDELSFAFVSQHNPKPDGLDFVSNARQYFEDRDRVPTVCRDNCTLVFANTAGRPLPGPTGERGWSFLLSAPTSPYSTDACPQTYSLSKNLGSFDGLGRCTAAILREKGSCAHSLTLRPPKFVNTSSGGRTLPIEQAFVFPLGDGPSDPRLPSDAVPAAVKWVNDRFDVQASPMECEGRHPLKDSIGKAHKWMCGRIRKMRGKVLESHVGRATPLAIPKLQPSKWVLAPEPGEPPGTPGTPNVDKWDGYETEALEMISYCAAVLGTCWTLEMREEEAPPHFVLRQKPENVDVLVVHGETHEACFDYARGVPGWDRRNPVLVVTRDRNDTDWDSKFGPIFGSKPQPSSDPRGVDITQDRFRRVSYKRVIGCLDSPDLETAAGRLRQETGIQ